MQQLRFIPLPLIVIAFFGIVIAAIILTKPEANRRSNPDAPLINIDVKEIELEDYSVEIATYGMIKALNQGPLMAQVSGIVSEVSDAFRTGGTFEKGDVLAKIEDADYLIALDIARAEVAEATSRLINEQALAEEARHEWRNAGRNGPPPPLAVREPQLKAAEAALAAAEARVAKAELDLERTRIKAPYRGRVLQLMVNEGELIASNTRLAEIFARATAEVLLPIQNKDLPFLDFDQDSAGPSESKLEVVITPVDKPDATYRGNVARMAANIDEQSRQTHVIARIPNAFEQNQDRLPLKVNQYVKARIVAKQLANAIVIPNKTIYQGNFVYLYDGQTVNRQKISIQWRNENHSVVNEGLKAGDQLVITPLGQVVSGTRAKVQNAEESLSE